MKLNRTSKFGREYIKLAKNRPHILNKIDNVIRKLEVNPFEPFLRTHKLRGRFEGIWACKVTDDIRILFEITEDENNELCILLVSVGKHDEVY